MQVSDAVIEEATGAVQAMVYSCEQTLLPEALRQDPDPKAAHMQVWITLRHLKQHLSYAKLSETWEKPRFVQSWQEGTVL